MLFVVVVVVSTSYIESGRTEKYLGNFQDSGDESNILELGVTTCRYLQGISNMDM